MAGRRSASQPRTLALSICGKLQFLLIGIRVADQTSFQNIELDPFAKNETQFARTDKGRECILPLSIRQYGLLWNLYSVRRASTK